MSLSSRSARLLNESCGPWHFDVRFAAIHPPPYVAPLGRCSQFAPQGSGHCALDRARDNERPLHLGQRPFKLALVAWNIDRLVPGTVSRAAGGDGPQPLHIRPRAAGAHELSAWGGLRLTPSPTLVRRRRVRQSSALARAPVRTRLDGDIRVGAPKVSIGQDRSFATARPEGPLHSQSDRSRPHA